MKTITDTEFLRTFQILSYKHNKWSVWQDFIFMAACSISNAVSKINYEKREQEYLRIINKYDKREQQLFPKLLAHLVMAMERNPDQDFLGSTFMRLELGNDYRGQFFTPYSVCKLMSAVSMDDLDKHIEDKGYFTINDCACGAGATLIAAINEAKERLSKKKINYQNHILVVAQDIDQTVGLMCYIQLSLLGVAGYVKIGDSLVNPISKDDKFDNYWFTPMYFSKVWTMRRMFRRSQCRLLLK